MICKLRFAICFFYGKVMEVLETLVSLVELLAPPSPEGTPLCGLYRYVRPQRV